MYVTITTFNADVLPKKLLWVLERLQIEALIIFDLHFSQA